MTVEAPDSERAAAFGWLHRMESVMYGAIIDSEDRDRAELDPLTQRRALEGRDRSLSRHVACCKPMLGSEIKPTTRVAV